MFIYSDSGTSHSSFVIYRDSDRLTGLAVAVCSATPLGAAERPSLDHFLPHSIALCEPWPTPSPRTAARQDRQVQESQPRVRCARLHAQVVGRTAEQSLNSWNRNAGPASPISKIESNEGWFGGEDCCDDGGLRGHNGPLCSETFLADLVAGNRTNRPLRSDVIVNSSVSVSSNLFYNYMDGA